MFELWIRTENDAFADGNRNGEIVRLLHKAADFLAHGEDTALFFDGNGNKVGAYHFKGEKK